jgi:hypothetical protein
MNRPAGISNIVALDPEDETLMDGGLLVDGLVIPAVSLSEAVRSQAETKLSSRIAQSCDPTDRKLLPASKHIASIIGPNLVSVGVTETLSGTLP